jgi:hypothetical protein
VRDVLFWFSGAALAFFATAGAFLFLANLSTVPSEKSLAPDRPDAGSDAAVELVLGKERLAALRPLLDQNLDLTVKNKGATRLSNVNVVLTVSSENTALPDTRYYRQTVDEVAPGKAADVHFELDLSDPEKSAAGRPASEPARKILEIRASTPEGISAVRTVILPP